MQITFSKEFLNQDFKKGMVVSDDDGEVLVYYLFPKEEYLDDYIIAFEKDKPYEKYHLTILSEFANARYNLSVTQISGH